MNFEYVVQVLIWLIGFISKVDESNQDRDEAIKTKVKTESNSDRTLTPTTIPNTNSPIILTPNEGNKLFKYEICCIIYWNWT